MSCSSNTIYYQPVSVPLTAGCQSCGCKNSVDSDLVIYSGPNLSCSGISTCDTVTTAIQKLDLKVCEAQEGILAINGVNRSGNYIKLGGPLTEPTVITTSPVNTLSILNLQDDNIPQYIVSLSNGILTRTTYQTILGFLTADNAITKTGTNLRLGGTLVIPTTIATDPVNTLSITGLVTYPEPDYILTQTTAGVVRRTLASTFIPTPVTVTANNGLTKTLNNIQLGGTLIIPTTIATSSTNTLSLTGLNTITTLPDYILTETSGEVVEKVDPVYILNAAAALITANNGLTKTGNNIQLGGSLLNNTTIQVLGNTLTLRDGATSGTGIDINCSVSSSLGGFPRNNFYQRNFFQDYVGIRTYPDGVSGGSTDIPLKVEKAGRLGFNDSFVTGSDSVLSMSVTGDNGNIGTRLYAGGTSRAYWNIAATQSIAPITVFSAHLSYFQFISSPLTVVTGANCSASAAQGYFVGSGGSLNRIIAYRAMNPVADTISGFTGAVGEAVGVQIEDQKSDSVMSSLIGDSYGIRQLGASDRNYFNGTFQIPSTNLSMGTATLVAGTVTVATTAVKTGSRVFLSVNTPGGTQGFLSAPSASIVNNTSFVINSSNVADTSTVNWWVINS